MDIFEVLTQVREQLQQSGRMTYRILKRQFALDDEALEELKEQLIDAERVAQDEEGRILVWTGSETAEETLSQPVDTLAAEPSTSAPAAQSEQQTPVGERRQLTVMFCDLVGSTALSEQLDPEELQSVVRTYQEVSAEVIERYEGYIAQYLGDGLLVYFGYPAAHEDDATRAIRAGLEIVTALDQARSKFPQPVHVRIGIHTGPVVVGEMGGGSRHEQLAFGETPNIAARVQGQAAPDTVVISAVTQRLVAGLFETEDRGRYEFKGISTPQPLYRVTAESAAQSRFEVAVQTGLTPLVGRASELQMLQERWTQVQAGEGQVVLLSGEPGIGKSRLVQELKDQVTQDGAVPIAFRCSPYRQNSALYPIVEHLQRLLQFTSNETPDTKLVKLQQHLQRYRFPQADTLALVAALLSLPHPEGSPPLTMSPQKQKELTQTLLVAWLVEESEQQPVYALWEDVHWVDPSTLEVLSLLLNQVPTTRLLTVLTFRPEFVPPWGTLSYLSQLTLSRLSQPQVNLMVERVTGGKALPEEVTEQIGTKTDGVPLFVEELTKMVVESDLVQAVNNHYELTGPLPPLAIPSTLQDSLMARLDRLAAAREVAQLGATMGREFSYPLLHAVSALPQDVLRQALKQLVETELVYQRGLLPQARYVFKHALIQDTAYASLLKSTRQQYHQQIARVLEEQFSEVVENQPELVARHYTEAGLKEQAIPYWHQAGQRASQRSANLEAISHLTTGLELLKTLPDAPERSQHELRLQIALGSVLQVTKGYAVPEARQAYARAHELCQQLGDILQLSPALYGLFLVSQVAGDLKTAHGLAEQTLSLAHRQQAPLSFLIAHAQLGTNSFYRGEPAVAREHLEQGIALYDPHRDTPQVSLGPQDTGVASWDYAAWALWFLGYPDQALKRTQEALSLARELAHPFSLAHTLYFAARLHQYRREGQTARKQAEAAMTLCTDQGFLLILAWGTVLRGWALAEQGQREEGITQIRQGIADWRAIGADLSTPYSLALLAETYGKGGQAGEGLRVVGEALTIADKNGERYYEAELYRLKGELTLLSRVQGPESRVQAAEECFHQAINVARRQRAKSLELRAAMSLGRLWQQQGKKGEARQLLSDIYSWFTEGFDTVDLKDARSLLDELSEGG